MQRRSNPLLIAIARRLNRDPTILLYSLLFILTTILLLNPEGIATPIANILAFLPAIATLKHIDRAHSTSKVEQGKLLLDYWVCIGTSFVLEQVLTRDVVGGLVPIWWLFKGMAGLLVWMSIDEGSKQRSGTPKNLSLVSCAALIPEHPKLIIQSTNKSRSVTDTFLEPEPSPSPIADCLSALIQGAQSNNYGESDDIIHPSRLPISRNSNLNLGKLDKGDLTPPISSPRDQLDAFLDSTAYPNGEEAISDEELSPAFILDGALAESTEHVPLARLPSDAPALAGGPQAKDKGVEEVRRGSGMTLDDLLEMEQNQM